MSKKICVCSDCVFKWLTEYVLGKKVTVKTNSKIVTGKLIGVKHDLSKRENRTDFMLILQTENGRIILEKWTNLSIEES